MVRWARRHWLWIAAAGAALGAVAWAIGADAAYREWSETGRAYGGPRCLP